MIFDVLLALCTIECGMWKNLCATHKMMMSCSSCHSPQQMWIECVIEGCQVTPFFSVSSALHISSNYTVSTRQHDTQWRVRECASADFTRFDDKCTISHSLNKYDMLMRDWCHARRLFASIHCSMLIPNYNLSTQTFCFYPAVKITTCNGRTNNECMCDWFAVRGRARNTLKRLNGSVPF